MNAHTPNQFLEFSNALKFEPFIFEPIDLSKNVNQDREREFTFKNIKILENLISSEKIKINGLKNQTKTFNQISKKLIIGQGDEAVNAISKHLKIQIENSIDIEITRDLSILEVSIAHIKSEIFENLLNDKIDEFVTTHNKLIKSLKKLKTLIGLVVAKSSTADLNIRLTAPPLNFTKLLAEIE